MYERDLAYVHHEGFGEFARQAAPELLRILRRAGVRRGLVVDLGCGSGIWARALVDRGYEVFGVDPSPSMITLARRHAPSARFRTSSAQQTPIPGCVAVTALGEVLGYHSRPPRGPSRLPELFLRVARALPMGGLFIFDLVVAETGPLMAYRTWRTGSDWAVLLDASERRDRGWLVRDIVTFRRVSRGFRRAVERHWIRLHGVREITNALRRAGFSVRVTRRYGSFPLASRRVGFVARKLRDGSAVSSNG